MSFCPVRLWRLCDVAIAASDITVVALGMKQQQSKGFDSFRANQTQASAMIIDFVGVECGNVREGSTTALCGTGVWLGSLVNGTMLVKVNLRAK